MKCSEVWGCFVIKDFEMRPRSLHKQCLNFLQPVRLSAIPRDHARFLSFARGKLRLCSANHRAGYFSNLTYDWLTIVWAYSEQETENRPITHSISIVSDRVTWHFGLIVFTVGHENKRRLAFSDILNVLCHTVYWAILTMKIISL